MMIDNEINSLFTFSNQQNDMSYLFLLFAFTCTSTYLVYKRWRYTNNVSSQTILQPWNKTRTVRELIQLISVSILIIWYANQAYSAPGLVYDPSSQRRSIISALTWIGISILHMYAPDVNQLCTRDYIYTLTIFYLTALIINAYHIYLSLPPQPTGNVTDWVGATICLVMFITVGTTPEPLDPSNTMPAANNDVENMDGYVHHNGSLLSPETTASPLSKATTHWIHPLIFYSLRNTVAKEDMYIPPFQYLARFVSDDFTATARSIEYGKIWKRVYTANMRFFWKQLISSLLYGFLPYFVPYLQQQFLEYIDNSQGRPIKYAYLITLSQFAVLVLVSWCSSIRRSARCSWNLRTLSMLNDAMYKKALRRKNTQSSTAEPDTKSTNTGLDPDLDLVDNISRTISGSSEVLSEMPSNLIFLCQSPIEITIALAYLYNLLGNSAFVGMSLILLFLPITCKLSNMAENAQLDYNIAKRHRENITSQVLQSIRFLKYLSWEKAWENKVQEARKVEIEKMKVYNNYDDLNRITCLVFPIVVTASTFIWFVKVTGGELKVSVIFISMSLFEMLAEPLGDIQQWVRSYSDIKLELNRISNFLEESGLDDDEQFQPIPVPFGSSVASILARTGFEECTIQYQSNFPAPIGKECPSSRFSLSVPSFDFPTGEFTIVTGQTGCGKSSLLGALLGEVDAIPNQETTKKRSCLYLPSKNQVDLKVYSRQDPDYPELALDKVAYVAQKPYLLNTTIRENILFGSPFDEERYGRALSHCALLQDLKVLKDSDRTIIGEEGVKLSGGQKARISLARAVYSRAKTLLIDDCLSAVDSETSKHIYQHCLSGDLLRGRTVVMVTHHVQLCLPRAKFHVTIDPKGCVTFSKNPHYSFKETNYTEDIHTTIPSVVPSTCPPPTVKAAPLEKKVHASMSANNPYYTYLAACGGWPMLFALVAATLAQRVSTVAVNWWLKSWAMSSENIISYDNANVSSLNSFGAKTTTSTITGRETGGENRTLSTDYYIGVYMFLCLLSVLIEVLRKRILYYSALNNARSMFKRVFSQVVGARLSFFDDTPIGIIRQRLTIDFGYTDTQTLDSAATLIECIIGIVAPALIISSITPWFFITAATIGAVYVIFIFIYHRVSADIKRYLSSSREPIMVHLMETLRGLATIRAYGQQERFLNILHSKLDDFTTVYYQMTKIDCWLNIRLNLFSALVTLSCSIFILHNLDTVNVGTAGIALQCARTYLTFLHRLISQITFTQLSLSSVVRIQEYIDLEQESPTIIEECHPPANWPTAAAVQIEDLTVSYTPKKPVLESVSANIWPSERIGVVGRTGSGKSTLIRALLRYMDPAHGSIKIDGVDISTIAMHDLRSRITIITQEEMLFPGTIRSNLDPFNEHNDDEIWEALQHAQLVPPLKPSTEKPKEDESMPIIASLSDTVTDEGMNFSQGQRQLLCLTRALLRKSKLIILDEASASIDFETDAKIQKTIRQKFSDSTLICVAHRLSTIIDYDRVLVMDEGKVVEYDTPYNLITKKGGVFRSLCRNTKDFDELLAAAEDTVPYSRRRMAAKNRSSPRKKSLIQCVTL